MHELDASPEKLHALDVRRLARGVLGSHVDHALEPESRGGGCGGNPVLEALSYAGPAFLLASAVLATYSFLVYFSNVWKFMVGPTS